MRTIKFRSAHYFLEKDNHDKFSHFSYWGQIDHKGEYSTDCFTCPSSSNRTYRKTEEQFTGLTDKNGKEIYEGDIVNEIHNGKYVYVSVQKTEKLVSVIKQCDVNPSMMLHRNNVNNAYDFEYDFVQCGLHSLEVIGNIHQNPELLK